MKITTNNTHSVLNRIIYISLAIIALFWLATLIEERSASGEISSFGMFTIFVSLFGVGIVVMALIVKLIFYILARV